MHACRSICGVLQFKGVNVLSLPLLTSQYAATVAETAPLLLLDCFTLQSCNTDNVWGLPCHKLAACYTACLKHAAVHFHWAQTSWLQHTS